MGLADPVTPGTRVLYVPTEEGDFRQVGLRRPLADLQRAGLVEAVSVFSLAVRIERGGAPEAHRADLVRHVAEFRPDVVLAQHLGGTGLRDRHFAAMRRAHPFRFVYHEGDPYRLPLHPLPAEARAAGRAADVVFTTGADRFVRNFTRAGAKDVRWAPSAFDAERFDLPAVDAAPHRPYDVVVIANRNRPRLRGHPNWRDRIRFVDRLQARFGDRVAVYGHHWTGPQARGPIDFARQVEAIRSGWISANWDHYAREASYFSNRLAISLAAGSVHATVRHPGYDRFFGPETAEFLLLEPTIDGLIDRIEHHLATTSPQQRIDAGLRAQAFAQAHLRQDDQLVEFLNVDGIRVDPAAAAACWDPSGKALQGI